MNVIEVLLYVMISVRTDGGLTYVGVLVTVPGWMLMVTAVFVSTATFTFVIVQQKKMTL